MECSEEVMSKMTLRKIYIWTFGNKNLTNNKSSSNSMAQYLKPITTSNFRIATICTCQNTPFHHNAGGPHLQGGVPVQLIKCRIEIQYH